MKKTLSSEISVTRDERVDSSPSSKGNQVKWRTHDSFQLMPIFDNGAAFLSDTRRDYPLTSPTVKLIDKVRCKPIVTHFDKQIDAVREVVGLSFAYYTKLSQRFP